MCISAPGAISAERIPKCEFQYIADYKFVMLNHDHILSIGKLGDILGPHAIKDLPSGGEGTVQSLSIQPEIFTWSRLVGPGGGVGAALGNC